MCDKSRSRGGVGKRKRISTGAHKAHRVAGAFALQDLGIDALLAIEPSLDAEEEWRMVTDSAEIKPQSDLLEILSSGYLTNGQ